jgi:glutamate dehydrogenase
VKAAHEAHTDVGDPSNDAIRVNGADVRARVIGEGGNLGCTQAGRIDYALRAQTVSAGAATPTSSTIPPAWTARTRR